MKQKHLVLLCSLLLGCEAASTPKVQSDHMPLAIDALARFVAEASYAPKLPRGEQITPPDPEVVAFLRGYRREGRKDHLFFLVEYGLKLHWINLEHTGLARELPTKTNLMISELVRLAGIPKFRTAHEGGWLNRQFDGQFDLTGWSSYQVYIWLKEKNFGEWMDYPDAERIASLLHLIDSSGMSGVGGAGVCHYGCQ